MRKYWNMAMVTVCLFVLFATSVSAQGEGQGNMVQQQPIQQGQFLAQQGQGQPGQEQSRQQIAIQVRGLIQQIREQRAMILQLRAEIHGLCMQLRERLRMMKEEGRKIDQELLYRFREQVRNVREERRELGQTLGQIRGMSLEVRAKRTAGQYGAIPGLFQGIFEVQQNRVRLLQGIKNELQEMLEALQ